MKLLFALFFLSVSVWAAETKTENNLWENNAEASFLVTSGNSEVTTLGLGLATIYSPQPWTVKGNLNYLTSKVSGTLNAESFSTQARGERKLSEPVSIFIQASYLKNQFSGFDDRIGGDTGANYAFLDQEQHKLSSELAVGVLKENRTDGGSETFGTGRAAVEYQWKFSQTSDFVTRLSILDNLARTSDWRLSNTYALTTILTEVLSLKLSFVIDHLNEPVTGKKKTDTTTTVALVAKF